MFNILLLLNTLHTIVYVRMYPCPAPVQKLPRVLRPQVVSSYLAFNVKTDVRLTYDSSQEFPSVTLCNNNRVHCGRLHDLILDCETVNNEIEGGFPVRKMDRTTSLWVLSFHSRDYKRIVHSTGVIVN